MKILRWMDQKALDLLYPDGAVCLICGRVSGGEALCPDCAEELRRDQLDTEGQTDRRRSVWPYDSIAGQLVRLLKEQAVEGAARVLAAGIAGTAREMALPEDTVVTSVPMPRRRYLERAIDHGRTLAACAAEELGLRHAPLLRRRKGSTMRTQRGLSQAERLANVRDAFEPAVPAMPRHVLLVDDVSTTGATGEACERSLLSGGAERVWIITATKA